MRITESYNRVHYALRPAKQVERRILIDALLLISDSGFPIRDYRYTGMGSIHFVDFSLFHKIIGIRNMLSVEISTKIENRIHFNAPYKEIINLEVGQPIGNFIPKLESDRQHLLWLDYDDILREEMLLDEIHTTTDVEKSEFIENINKGNFMTPEYESIFKSIKTVGMFRIKGDEALNGAKAYIECSSLNWL